MAKLLNSGNYKTRKGEKYGWKTYGIHLAPYNLSGKNVCASASAGCSAACLNTAGRGSMHSVQDARVKKHEGFSRIGMDSYRSYTKKSKARLKALRKKS